MKISRPSMMLWIVAIGLFISGVTIWPAIPQLEFIVRKIWGDASATGEIHAFTLKVIDGLKHLEDDYAKGHVTGGSYEILQNSEQSAALIHRG